MIWLEIRLLKRLQGLLQKVLVRIQKRNMHNQQRCLRKYTYHQKRGSKLLMNFHYYSCKYIAIMENQKITNLLDKNCDQSYKFRTRKLVEVSDNFNEIYETVKQIKFYNVMVKLSLCDYSDGCILVKEL